MISIIIATYNRAPYILETLQSIAQQTYKNFECIIIDDGSTDHTSEVVAPIIANDSRFIYKLRPHTQKKGANHSRNYGFTLSKGDYIKFFDSDDVMLPTHLEESITTLVKNHYDFVVADCINFDASGLLERPYNIDRKNSPISAIRFAQFKTAWITNDLLVKRQFANKLQFEGDIRDQASEYQYNIRLLLFTTNGFLINKILTHRRIHDDGFVVKAKKDIVRFDIMSAEMYYITAKNIKNLASKALLRWLLSSHVLLTYKLSTQRVFPENVIGATLLLFKVNGIKALMYPLSIISGYISKKGYKLSKIARG